MHGNNEKKLIGVSALPYLTYYNVLYEMLRVNTRASNIVGFRYKSFAEAELWADIFSSVPATHTLLFYSILEELRILLEHKEARASGVEEEYDQNVRLVILGLFWERHFREDTQSIIRKIGEDGEDILELLRMGGDMVDKASECFYQQREDESEEDYIGGMVDLFETADFINKHQEFFSTTDVLLNKIKDSNVLDTFFSLRAALNKKLLGLKNRIRDDGDDATLDTIFFNDAPIYCYEDGKSSLFSVIFSKILLKSSDKELLDYLELSRIYNRSREYDKSQIRNAALEHGIKLVIDKKKLGRHFSDSSIQTLSKVIFSGMQEGDIRKKFCDAYNYKFITNMKKDIEDIATEQMNATSEEIRKKDARGEITESIAKEMIGLFFINVFSQVEALFIEKKPLLHHSGYNDEDYKALSLQVSDILKKKISEIKKEKGWIWEA